MLAQTLERQRRNLEAEEIEYAEKLTQARRKEAALRKAARARIHKRPVSQIAISYDYTYERDG